VGLWISAFYCFVLRCVSAYQITTSGDRPDTAKRYVPAAGPVAAIDVKTGFFYFGDVFNVF